MLANSDGVRLRRDLPDEIAGIFTHKSKCRLDIRVFWKVFCAWQVDGGARWLYFVFALLSVGDCGGHAMNITQEEFGGVNQNGVAIFGGNLKAPEHGLRKGRPHGASLISIVRDSAILLIFSHQEHLFTATLKMDDVTFARLAPVQANIVGPHAAGKRFVQNEWRLPLGIIDAQPERPFARVPVVGEESGKALHPASLFRDVR